MLRISLNAAMRHRQANGVKAHIVSGFKVPRNLKFAETLEDIVILYISPPEDAQMLGRDEMNRRRR